MKRLNQLQWFDAGQPRAKEKGRLAKIWTRFCSSSAATLDNRAQTTSLPTPPPWHTKTKAKTSKFTGLRRTSFMDLAPARSPLAQALALSLVRKTHSRARLEATTQRASCSPRASDPPLPHSPMSPLSRTSCVSTVFSDCGEEPGTPLTPASFASSIPPTSPRPSPVVKDYAFFHSTPTPTSPTSSWCRADSATLAAEEGEEDWTLALDLALSAGMLIGAPRSVALQFARLRCHS